MLWILARIIDILCVYLILIPAGIILQKWCLTENIGHHKNVIREIVLLAFVTYVTAVASVTGLPSVKYLVVDFSINFIPFTDVFSSIKGYILNVILFIPMGVFLPMLWERFRSVKQTVIMGFFISGMIELLQIFTWRATDIDDLITNTCGTFLGYLMMYMVNKVCGGKLYLSQEEETQVTVLWIFAVVFLSVFFVTPFISEAIWNLIL